MNTRTCILALLLLSAHYGRGQFYYFRHFQVENGLSNNAVICSLQDKKGFLWFGTKDGLDRFDGYSFKVFRSDPDDSGSIGSNFIHSLYEDPQGVLWVGTEKGLYRHNATTESFSLLRATGGWEIRDIQMDSSGRLWFVSGFTLFRYNPAAQQLVRYDKTRYFEASSVCRSSDGALWISTTSGLLEKYNPAGDAFTATDLFAHSPKNSSTWIEKIYATSNGLILAGTAIHGAKLFDTR
ncbi:MAG TPA: two-component regulator propeller domain-containing protein, partial [Chitinophagaceae bacterium]|nr:two-component regulator propeller domain-containing protein [Chitinophagaceae bacterium]